MWYEEMDNLLIDALHSEVVQGKKKIGASRRSYMIMLTKLGYPV